MIAPENVLYAAEGVKHAAASDSSGYNIGCAFAANYSDGVIICTVTKLIARSITH
jgi:hypothetical protein